MRRDTNWLIFGLVVILSLVAIGISVVFLLREDPRTPTVGDLEVGETGWVRIGEPAVDTDRQIFIRKGSYMTLRLEGRIESWYMRIERRADGFHLTGEDSSENSTDYQWERGDLSSLDVTPVVSFRIGDTVVYSAGDPAVGEVPLSYIKTFPVSEMRVGEVACIYKRAVRIDPEGRMYIPKTASVYGQDEAKITQVMSGCESYSFSIQRREEGFHAVVTGFTGQATRELASPDEHSHEHEYYPVTSLRLPSGQLDVGNPHLNGYEYPKEQIVQSVAGKGARMSPAYLSNFPVTQLEVGEVGFLRRDDVVLDKDRRMYIYAVAEAYGTSMRQGQRDIPRGLKEEDAPLLIWHFLDGEYYIYTNQEDKNYHAYSKDRFRMLPDLLKGNSEFVPIRGFFLVESRIADESAGEAGQLPWRYVLP